MKVFLSILIIALSTFGLDKTKNLSDKDSVCIDSVNTKYSFPRPEQYDPISFMDEVSRIIKTESLSFMLGMTMVDEFPKDWVKKEHIETLILSINSTDRCVCFLNPLSSFIPNDYAEKGGYAALFIKAYKDKEQVSFGLYACPKVDTKLNEELISWWNKYKNE